MTARFWRRATLVSGLGAIVLGLVWIGVLLWANPTLETLREHGWIGQAVAVLSALSAIADARHSAAVRAGR